MRAEIVFRNDRWFAQIVDETGNILFTSKAERRAGCAARVALNTLEQMYGSPSTDKFVIDVGDW
jgi:hypothetical protein